MSCGSAAGAGLARREARGGLSTARREGGGSRGSHGFPRVSARQAEITQEILEVVGGAEALS
ncbi:MAG: F0F1 ATP synthase subunit gamma [Actinobacteria bacterium]|nr:F0F1 ATP synthase subunit gamma [Actinomycetota bacterium]